MAAQHLSIGWFRESDLDIARSSTPEGGSKGDRRAEALTLQARQSMGLAGLAVCSGAESAEPVQVHAGARSWRRRPREQQLASSSWAP